GHSLSLEVHLFGFDKDIYGQRLTVSVLWRIRDEKKFASIDELVAQLHMDKQNVIEFLYICVVK
ncbi:MAG: riboflavin kinase, partial [Prevotellaceae bacterium]|nr:riboflavin kinase [Prevotellaceae bacterium]